ncbi:hypothetical protein DB346_04345 [Verrucomicrobia bacterium LW23]|nr:hypothetical protein DB346_04345 [Verrucomicrobia bacterium LW23]
MSTSSLVLSRAIDVCRQSVFVTHRKARTHARFSRGKQGYALILVLSVIALCVVMVTAFLSRSTQERSAAAGNKATADARRLGDIAVSLVQGQINHATTQGTDIAWTSQPGMVRTFTSTGNLRNAYKLYSAPKMIDTAVSLTDDMAPSNWAESTAVWVDINAPVTSGGVKNFPILAYSSKAVQDLNDPSPTKNLPSPKGDVLPVEGFSLGTVPGTPSEYQPIPMPLRWLYVLQDGQLVAPPATATGKTVDIAGATSSNPIVGRIAFWTDDETCKININTAGEPTFWDTPRNASRQDYWGFAYRQPAHGEYQRYPGHPAMVAMSSAFPFEALADDPLPPAPATVMTDYRHVDDFMKLAPRYTFAGSKAGTVSFVELKAQNATRELITAKDDERLYTSLDEMLFRPTMTAGNRTTESFLTRPLLDSRKFFLTAHSRAPETNLYNLPRIATWPIYRLGTSDWNDRTTAYDRAMLFCSSTGPTSGTQRPYIFQRELALDPNNDWDNIQRNRELYDYLQYLTSRPIPGVANGGATFLTKYPNDRDSILTQMMDYIRCTNLCDANLVNSAGVPMTNKMFARYDGNAAGAIPGASCVAPLHGPNNTMGQGRWHTLKQLTTTFFATATGAHLPSDANGSNIATNDTLKVPYPTGVFTPLAPGETRVQLHIMPEIITTMGGFRQSIPQLTVEILGLDACTINGTNLKLPERAYTVFYNPTQALGGDELGPDYPQSMAAHYKLKVNRPTAELPYPANPIYPIYGPGGVVNYPFISTPVTVTGSTMTFGGAPITVNLYAGETTTGASVPSPNTSSNGPAYDPTKRRLVQTFRMLLPTGAIPVPTMGNNKEFWSVYTEGTGFPSTTRGRFYQRRAGDTSAGLIDGTNDVVRSMIPKVSDFRIVQTLRDSSDMFVPHPSWNSTTVFRAWYTYNSSSTASYNGKFTSKDPVGMDNLPRTAADLPSPLPTGVSLNPCEATGDFDGNMGAGRPGAMANKPDDGDLGSDGTWVPYFQRNRDGDLLYSFFSPNRVTPGAGMFGSLSTCARSPFTQWRTLLFRPPAADAESTHYGNTSPKDHYFLDLFWMPVVAPWAISDRFSTAGKINMNYQIMPFTYINRATAMHAVLKGERTPRFPNASPGYAPNINSGNFDTYSGIARNDRKVIDPDLTLQQFRDRFNQADVNRNVFITSSEICEITLVPRGESLASARNWNNFRVTADNIREKPYATMLPKLTTKSNTYLVHFRAQSLKKAVGSDPAVWVEGRDAVTSEYRGSTAIERFINPDADIPDYAALTMATPGDLTVPTLDTFYKWRVIRNTQFAP